MKFGEYIRARRESLGLTQPHAAAKANIEQSYLSKLESGKNYPSETIFQKIAELYELDVDAMSKQIYSAEFDKLREISAVRALIKRRLEQEATHLRGWLLGGLLLLVLGTGNAAYQLFQEPHQKEVYLYVSTAVIPQGKVIKDYDKDIRSMTGEEAILKIDNHILELENYVARHFVKEVEGGTRVYRAFDKRTITKSNANTLILSLSAAITVAGLACFYIARRWR